MANVLIVEDEDTVARMYETAFRHAGHIVHLAPNGEECFDKAKSQQFNVILLDLMLPVMNGFETLRKLKLDAVTKDIPVIVISNLYGAEYESEAMRLGAIRFVTKSSIEPAQLVQLVADVLKIYAKTAA